MVGLNLVVISHAKSRAVDVLNATLKVDHCGRTSGM